MVDFSAQTRLHGYLYTSPEVKNAVASFREQYRDNEQHSFKTARVQPHDCRTDAVQEHNDKREWEAWLLSHGLRATAHSKTALYDKPAPAAGENTQPDKLLYSFGARGSGRGEFSFPRGVAADTEGDLLVVDTANHRVQRFNSAGVYKDEFGTRGEFRGEFLQPSGVAVLDNDDVVVADKGNRRVQIFRASGRLKHFFSTGGRPAHVACDNQFHIIVSTVERVVEVYDINRKLVSEFSLGPSEGSDASAPCPIMATESGEIIVADPCSSTVRSYSYDGQLLTQFEPLAAGEGLGVQLGGLALNPIGQLVVTDTLNHTVNLYNDRGVLLQTLLGPADDLGSAHACAVTPEGHLVVTEFSINGPHAVKVYRYGDCECHRNKGGSSKRTTPAPSPK